VNRHLGSSAQVNKGTSSRETVQGVACGSTESIVRAGNLSRVLQSRARRELKSIPVVDQIRCDGETRMPRQKQTHCHTNRSRGKSAVGPNDVGTLACVAVAPRLLAQKFIPDEPETSHAMTTG